MEIYNILRKKNMILFNWPIYLIRELEKESINQEIMNLIEENDKNQIISTLNDFLWTHLFNILSEQYKMDFDKIIEYTEDNPPDDICFFKENNSLLLVQSPHYMAKKVFKHYQQEKTKLSTCNIL